MSLTALLKGVGSNGLVNGSTAEECAANSILLARAILSPDKALDLGWRR